MIKIIPMQTTDIPCAIDLWKQQFVQYCYCDSFPPFHDVGEATVKKYIEDQLSNGNAVVAVKDNEIVGYMAWLTFDFHNERTAFLPVTGYAASSKDELNIYPAMYNYVSKKWVEDNRFNHLWMIYFDDEIAKNSLYELGFGSYVIDACQSTDKIMGNVHCDYKIELATIQDTNTLLEIANTSNRYYMDSPIFLKRGTRQIQDIQNILEQYFVLVARDGDKIVGVMSFSVNKDFDFEQLTTPDSAYIGNLGAFIYPEYRGKGVGKALLKNTFDICRESGKSHIHVCFESANPNASNFWPKYFKPAIRSVRRTVNKDANEYESEHK